MRSIRWFAMAGAVAVLMAACGGGGDDQPTGLPSGLPTALPSGLPTALPSGLPTALPSGLPTGLPTGLPGGSLSTGTAHLEFSGAATATVDLPFDNGAYAAGIAIGLAYQDEAKNTFAIAGTAFTGTATTSSTLTVSYVLTNPIAVGTSAGGECTLTLSEATATSVKGTVDCQGIQGGTGAQNITGTFEATG
jgi:hypothetical protein